ncbi:DUF6318 family protein [Geodermatophilus sp. SYSU D00779]
MAGLAAGTVVLSGCSERQEAADTLPEADATPSASQSLPPLGPPDLPMPAEARTQDAAGAEAFVRYYIDLINRTSTVMDAASLREFSDGCLDCDRIAADTEEDASAGHRYKGGQLAIMWLEVFKPTDEAEVAFTVDQAALQVIDQTGTAVPELSFPAYPKLSSGASIRWVEDKRTWIMTGLTLG